MVSPGDLDTSFSGDGKKTIDFGGVDTANVVLVQPNGRIVVAGGTVKVSTAPSRFCVARLRSNGVLDTAFGSGGKRVISFGGHGLGESVLGAALQPDGKIVLAGGSDLRAAVARLNPNGSLDTTFSGDGKKTFNWAPGDFSRTQAVLVLPNGKLVVAGFSGPEGGDIQAARLKANGALDTAFGTGGKARVDFGGTEFGFAAARQADGRIVVAGGSTAGGAVVARLRANGTLDPDFDGDGRLMLPGGGEARAVLVQPDSKIVVTGNPGSQRGDNRHAAEPERVARHHIRRRWHGDHRLRGRRGTRQRRGAAAGRQDRRRRLRAGRRRRRAPQRQRIARRHVRRRRKGDRRLRRRHVRPRGRAPAQRPDRCRRPAVGRRLRGGAPARLTQASARRQAPPPAQRNGPPEAGSICKHEIMDTCDAIGEFPAGGGAGCSC
jgi:uncharacterized delta-60 repeat protein